MISRRSLLQGATAATAAVALGRFATACSPGGSDPSTTNVLLVLADDMRADFLRFAEQIEARLGKGGRTFSVARANVSLCQPYRVGLLTGEWSERHKMLGNGDTRTVPHDNTIGKWVQDAGYRTALIGKYLNGAPAQTPKPAGWTVWRQLVGDTDPNAYERLGYRVCDGATTTQPKAPEIDYLRDETIAFVAGSEPWFCMMTPTAPHFPFEPAPEDATKWSDLEWATPVETDVSDKPSWYSSLALLSEATQAGFRDQARAQAREISGLDRAVVQVLDTLSAKVLAKTVVIFSSDGGLSYGDHRSPYGGASKNDFYECNQRVPLICHGPGFTTGISTEPVSPEADITKTILALTGATAGLPGDGIDLRTIQDHAAAHAGRHLLHERGGGGGNNPNPYSGLCVSTATRKLMRWTGQVGQDRYEAYDLDTDPDELESWAFDPARRAERDALEAELDRLSPPPSLVPKLLYAGSASSVASLVTDSIQPRYHSVLVLDVYGVSEGEVADVTLTGGCIEKVVLHASHSQLDDAGLRRRLMSFEARGTGLADAITVTAGAGQSLGSVGLTVTQYAYHSAVVQTVAAGTDAGPSRSVGVSLAPLQAPANTIHVSVLADTSASIKGEGGAKVLHDAAPNDQGLRFATLWIRGDASPTASSSLPGHRSIAASEIGT